MSANRDTKHELLVDSKHGHAGHDPQSPQVIELDDRDILPAAKNDYDPVYDKRDMRRLGKVQELKVR